MAHQDINRLHAISQKSSRLIIGLMSGTSLDGLDIALCKITGNGMNTKAELLEFVTMPYDDDFKEDIKTVFAKKLVDLEKLTLLNAVIGDLHAQLILQALSQWNIKPADIDCIASHGQTIYHAPESFHGLKNYPNATLQIGDGDHIAVKTGIITLSDFRQKHIAAGGEGAPLALYGDCLLFSSPTEDRILLNIGGIANFTFLPANKDPNKLISTDTGPGNTLIDALAKKNFDVDFDRNADIALSGKVNPQLLTALLDHPFYAELLPKTTGPELFNLEFINQAKIKAGISTISPQDEMATVTRLTAETISAAIKTFGDKFSIYVSGGGCHNPLVIRGLKDLMPESDIKDFIELGIDPDAKEALLFALLANETFAGEPIQFANAPAITMGKISLPG